MQELKEVEVTVVQVPKYVKYECPHCGREVEVDYDDFNDDRMSDYWPEWEGDTVICDECGSEFAIGNVEVEKMRPIDADRLKEAIHTDFSEHFTLYHDTDQTALFDMVMDDIDEMPTAFDKEKVIEELKDAEDIPHDDSMAEITSTRIWNKAIKKSIKIVEKGGIE